MVNKKRRSVLKSIFSASVVAAHELTHALASAPSDQAAQLAHAKGACGSMGPGTGLSGNRGWIVSMLPGRHHFRVQGGLGQVHVTATRASVVDFDAGRPYYLVVEGAGATPVIEWKTPGSNWGRVPNYFLYPVTR